MIINRLQPIVRWTLAIILMFAGAAKLVQTDAFARTLADTGFLTTAEAGVTAIALPAAEVILALLLVTGLLSWLVHPAVLLLSVCFTAVHGYAVVHGSIDCGCLGLTLQSGVSEWVMFGISLAMAIGAFVLVVTSPGRLLREVARASSQPAPVPAPPAAD